MPLQSRVQNPILHPLLFIFQVIQFVLDKLLSPTPPSPKARLGRPRIAVIGGGITGVTSAAHCIGHGCDVQIFEAGKEENIGGIWSRVNNTSSLQIHSLMYRFHPSVNWQQGYPDKHQILSQVRQLWKRYRLDERTVFETPVTSARQDPETKKWTINDDAETHGQFDGIICAIGTCGEPKVPHMPGMDSFQGEIHHSSQLTGKAAKGKTLIIIGGGASAVESLEFAVEEGAAQVYVLARSEKWIIPRNPVVNMLLALNIFGQETWFSWIPEFFLRKLFYRELEDIAPPSDKKGLFTDTPMVNSEVMNQIRSGKVKWLRCDIEGFAENGVKINRRKKGTNPNDQGQTEEIGGDMVVMATGYERPKLDFLPKECLEGDYKPPNWYLQTFPPQFPSVSAINCTYMNGIGSVGNWHIGIYTRLLLVFLLDDRTRPYPFWMKRWIDMTSLLKERSPVGPFEFFTYLELMWWFFFCIAINPFRWKWAFFVFFGLGEYLPMKVVAAEDRLRNRLQAREAEEQGTMVNGVHHVREEDIRGRTMRIVT
ncbi:hypothetical protein QBC32DRAFT_341327 [Pseudoneurospora amorphoporcata]|uniref:FAD/NAD(P)-binding domain-containing protein n=1 Tax=Pseudoneurospora amorphoporcata TaxID=241081 RepID=A0AAN6SGR8_9PEZI|nr:hypothetical protein QBC32DRAFT_341327 [Pseudoneurospora amorphoporcata]